MRAKDICQAHCAGNTLKGSKFNRFIARQILTEPEPGLFTLAPRQDPHNPLPGPLTIRRTYIGHNFRTTSQSQQEGRPLPGTQTPIVLRGLMTIVCVVALIGLSSGVAGAKEAVPSIPPYQAPASLAYPTKPCDPSGSTSADAELASRLNTELQSDMRGYMDAYRTSCARMVVEAARTRGLESRAAVIAITTVIVETHLQNISVPVDHTSLGLFQQQDWWGTPEQRLDATWATNKFLNVMESKYPNRSWMTAPIGDICQSVQVSAYPERYQAQASDAQIIVNALWGAARPAAPAVMRDDSDGTMTIWKWESTGSAFVLDSSRYESGPWSIDQVGDRFAAGDVNGDGYDDVVAAYQNAEGKLDFHVWSKGRTYDGKWYTSSGLFGLDPVAGRLVIGDFNRDGRAEPAVMRDDSDGTMTIWKWESTGSAFVLDSSRYESGPWSIDQVGDRFAAGDVNGDGYDDVVAAYQNAEGKLDFHVWSKGRTYDGKWYTSSGLFGLDPVAGRLVIGAW